MFSELPHYPRQTIQISSKEQIPQHVEKDWVHPSYKIQAAPSYQTEVTGKFRHKFFSRPNKQMLSTLPHIVMYAMKDGGPKGIVGGAGAVVVPEGRTKTVGTQSVYRESETQ